MNLGEGVTQGEFHVHLLAGEIKVLALAQPKARQKPGQAVQSMVCEMKEDNLGWLSPFIIEPYVPVAWICHSDLFFANDETSTWRMLVFPLAGKKLNFSTQKTIA